MLSRMSPLNRFNILPCHYSLCSNTVVAFFILILFFCLGTCGVWTKGGNANGGCCVFPFKYNGVMHYTCTYLDHNQPWCSISMNYDRDGVWGECIGNWVPPLTFCP